MALCSDSSGTDFNHERRFHLGGLGQLLPAASMRFNPKWANSVPDALGQHGPAVTVQWVEESAAALGGAEPSERWQSHPNVAQV